METSSLIISVLVFMLFGSIVTLRQDSKNLRKKIDKIRKQIDFEIEVKRQAEEQMRNVNLDDLHENVK